MFAAQTLDRAEVHLEQVRVEGRAEKQADTRRRITEASVELHEQVGPANTTVAEVARRAGVTRLTVYNNFPEERELFAACQGHWMELHPPPRYDRAEGAEAVLRSVYGWYLAQALGGGPLTALALDFWTWRRRAAEGLDDEEAAALMARAIECA